MSFSFIQSQLEYKKTFQKHNYTWFQLIWIWNLGIKLDMILWEIWLRYRSKVAWRCRIGYGFWYEASGFGFNIANYLLFPHLKSHFNLRFNELSDAKDIIEFHSDQNYSDVSRSQSYLEKFIQKTKKKMLSKLIHKKCVS